ncbi:cms1 ribosomal small subunit [Turdus rufiventris]|nr:cms1 ribosomal small subunit [Turdus rufiventris]
MLHRAAAGMPQPQGRCTKRQIQISKTIVVPNTFWCIKWLWKVKLFDQGKVISGAEYFANHNLCWHEAESSVFSSQSKWAIENGFLVKVMSKLLFRRKDLAAIAALIFLLISFLPFCCPMFECQLYIPDVFNIDGEAGNKLFSDWFIVGTPGNHGFQTIFARDRTGTVPEPSDDDAIEKASGKRTATCQDQDSKPAVKKKRKQPIEVFLNQPEEKQESTVKAKKRKKKKISDVLQKSAPKPGVPADLQNLLTQHFGENRSVIEIEELQLSVCPKWAKLRRNHKEKKSVVMLVLCSSALRSLELIKSMTAFKGDCRVLKLFAKHIKIKEQMNMLEKGMFHIGVGTPGRVKALVEQDALCLNSMKYMILDWNWRDQKLRRMVDIPEIDYSDKCSDCSKLRENSSNWNKECRCSVNFTLKEDILGDVFMYYGLQNFYQNHRRFVMSRSDAQLLGRNVNIQRSYCAPFSTYRNGTPMAPCGAIANSMFNDTIDLFYNRNSSVIQVPLLKTGNSWWTDKNVKFCNPESYNLSSAFAGTARPPYWQKPVYLFDEEDDRNNGYVNDDFIIWMRVSAFATFRNLYRRVRRVRHFTQGLPAGNYTFQISYSDFNLPDVCWELNTAEKRQSRKFLECVEDNSLW